MSYSKFATSTRRFALRALVAMLAVCLTACSDYLKEWDNEALGQAQPKPAPVAEAKPATPDIPPHLVKCIEKTPPPGKTADEKVKAITKTDAERKACAKAILAWYKEVQKANKTAEKKKAGG